MACGKGKGISVCMGVDCMVGFERNEFVILVLLCSRSYGTPEDFFNLVEILASSKARIERRECDKRIAVIGASCAWVLEGIFDARMGLCRNLARWADDKTESG